MKELILIEDPHVKSRAAFLRLRKKLIVADDSSRAYWLRFRLQLLTTWLAERGDLVCHYCGKPHLLIEDYDVNKVATLDHVMPLAKGGARYDVDNLVVACSPCNAKKADKILCPKQLNSLMGRSPSK